LKKHPRERAARTRGENDNDLITQPKSGGERLQQKTRSGESGLTTTKGREMRDRPGAKEKGRGRGKKSFWSGKIGPRVLKTAAPGRGARKRTGPAARMELEGEQGQENERHRD